MKKKRPDLTITPSSLASLAGITTRRIRQLAADGTIPAAGDAGYPRAETIRRLFAHFRTKQTATADYNRAKIAESLERTLALKRTRLERDGVLVELAEVQRLYGEALMPIRQRLLALPNEAASRCNPTDPECARRALQLWLDDSLPMIRAGITASVKRKK